MPRTKKPLTAKQRLAADGLAALAALTPFMGERQRRCVKQLMRGEEKEFFFEKMIELARIVGTMASTYDQDGLGEDATVYLHYFAGGAANWWITEKDKETADEPGQHQAFGLANFFGGPNDQDAELGYISLVEILSAGAELDFHFTPRTLRELKGGIKPAPTPPEPSNIVPLPDQSAGPLEKAQAFFANL